MSQLNNPHFLARLCILAVLLIAFWIISFDAKAMEFEVLRGSNPSLPTFVLLRGPIEREDGEKFESAVQNIDHAVVLFQSPGGSLQAGLAIGAVIRIKGFSTGVGPNHNCVSACALAWLGGIHRYMEPSSKIGFNSAYSEGGSEAHESGADNALVGAYLNELKLPLSAIKYIAAADASEMRWLSITDAMRIGINVTALSASHVPQARTKDNSDKTEIERATRNLNAGMKKSGVQGMRASVDECYGRFANTSTSLGTARYCFAIDYGTMRLDQEFARMMGARREPYFEDHLVLTRVNEALDRLGMNQETKGQVISLWSQLSEQAISKIIGR